MDRHRLVHPFVMWAIILAGIVPLWLLLSDREVIPYAPWRFVFLALAGVYWVYFFMGAVRVNRQLARGAGAIEHIVSTGVYGRVRHPVYSANIVLAWGFVSCVPSHRGLAAVAWMTVVLVAWMRLEERALGARFGAEYRDYRARVPMCIPRPWRRG